MFITVLDKEWKTNRYGKYRYVCGGKFMRSCLLCWPKLHYPSWPCLLLKFNLFGPISFFSFIYFSIIVFFSIPLTLCDNFVTASETNHIYCRRTKQQRTFHGTYFWTIIMRVNDLVGFLVFHCRRSWIIVATKLVS